MKINLTYLADIKLYETEKPYDSYGLDLPDIPSTNCIFEEHDDIDVVDIRFSKEVFDLSTTGFKYINSPSQVSLEPSILEDATRATVAIEPYLNETICLVRRELGAHHVQCFDWRMRRRGVQRDLLKEKSQDLDYDRFRAIATAKTTHSDYSYNGGRARFDRQLFQGEADKYAQENWRFQFINDSVWRPLNDVVRDAPLALCDRRSVRRDDLVPVDKVHENIWEEGLYLKYRTYHRWYWKSLQTKDEAIMFISWDSTEGHDNKDDLDDLVGKYFLLTYHTASNRSACPPHVSFEHPDIPAGCPPRESVEVRLIAFFKE